MHDLRVTGVEDDALLATAEDGSRYRIPLDAETYALLRRRSATPQGERKVAPRDIQSHIRSGMSAHDVAELTGAPIEYIQKFEGPVLAERQFVVNAALAVPVNTASDSDPLNGSTFGAVMEERLEELGARDVAWASWKDPETGWTVKLGFTANEVEHDARWQFDPKKSTLAPINNDATRISQQGDVSASLIPRLRAVPAERTPDATRFDSGAFTDDELSPRDTAPYADAIPFARGSQSVSPAAINREPRSESDAGNTADLLEALRRRRGEREAPPHSDAEDSRSAHPSTGSIRVIDIPLDDFDSEADASSSSFNSKNDDHTNPQPSAPTTHAPDHSSAKGSQSQSTSATGSKGQRRGRVSMPSWDDIVFGAKADDD
ncbi:septation protein SepH [Salinibacterium sp. SYSU T00001]|uniref:septation protein SepH n=1 Tax=Homoserinimonas sedimenticola TaxID=2986805 RepID=UPI00223629E4|nr:septation protein SepH [Salinibacterium sedimenticola]MCW4384502.1 septation protein SepH [Salinibacterium sedimenticola]